MKRFATTSGVLALCLLLGACSSPASSTSPTTFQSAIPGPETPAVTPSSSSTVPEPAPSQIDTGGFSGVAHIKDKDGYTFDVNYSYAPKSFNVVTADEKPGMNSLVIKLSSTFSLQNTTAGRKVTFQSVSGIVEPLSDPHFYLIALWKGTSPVCSSALQTPSPDARCGILLSFGRVVEDLPVGGSSSLTVYAGLENGGGDAGIAHVPDANLAAVKNALSAPDDFVLAYSAGDTPRFVGTCPNPDLDKAMSDSFSPGGAASIFNNGFMPLYSKSGTCQAFSLVSPPTEN